MENASPVFSIVPIEAWLDKRLRLETLRVLGALLSFRGKDTNTIWPRREQIATRCGMSITKISESTSELERLGWLQKEGKGGFSKATRYTITVPDSVTVPQSVTVPEQGSTTVPYSGTGMRVPYSGTGKEVTKNIPIEEKGDSSPGKRSKAQKQEQTLSQFVEACKATGEMVIPSGDPIYSYAEKVGLQDGMVEAAWECFRDYYLHGDGKSKRYSDWRATFRRAVKMDYYRLWYLKEGQPAQWSTAGEQARRAAA